MNQTHPSLLAMAGYLAIATNSAAAAQTLATPTKGNPSQEAGMAIANQIADVGQNLHQAQDRLASTQVEMEALDYELVQAAVEFLIGRDLLPANSLLVNALHMEGYAMSGGLYFLRENIANIRTWYNAHMKSLDDDLSSQQSDQHALKRAMLHKLARQVQQANDFAQQLVLIADFMAATAAQSTVFGDIGRKQRVDA